MLKHYIILYIYKIKNNILKSLKLILPLKLFSSPNYGVKNRIHFKHWFLKTYVKCKM